MKAGLSPWNLWLACNLPALLIATSVFADGTPVHIELQGSQGKGLAVMRGIDCYVLTAAHVLRRPVGIFVVGAQQRRTEADIFADLRERSWDVAVLKVRDPAQVCRADYYTPTTRLENLLRPSRAATLRLRSEAGDEHAVPVSVIKWDEDHLHLQAPAGVLHESLSGSIVYIEDQRVAMLVTIPAGDIGLAQAIRIDRIATLTKDFLRLDPPTERAELDDAVAMERLRANLNFVESGQFCDSLYRAARWTYERKPTLQYRERRSGLLAPVYIVDSFLIPTIDSEIALSDKNAEISTKIARVPPGTDAKPFWDRTARAIDKCLSKLGQVKNLRFRSGPHEGSYGSTYWWIEYTSDWGMSMKSISVWLGFDGVRLSVSVRLSK